MSLQVQALSGLVSDIVVVVGFKKELIMEAFPDLTYLYNPAFDVTNTSKSLLTALRKMRQEDVIWLNGDVVLDGVFLAGMIGAEGSRIAVNTARVAEEEIKYRLGADGKISELSKQVQNGLGEAVGINIVRSADIPVLKESLEACGDQDYFERGIELAIARGSAYFPYEIAENVCVEVDFPEDLIRAQAVVSPLERSYQGGR